MNGNGLKEIKEADKRTALNREFPGESCGNAECENLCAEANEIAKMLHINPQEMVNLAIRREILPKYHSISGEGVTHHFCRFGFASPGLKESVLFSEDERKIIGKKYISDTDASESGACKECLKNANKVFRWPEEAHLMPKLPIHPNCKCHYENVYEEDDMARAKKLFEKMKNRIQTSINEFVSVKNMLKENVEKTIANVMGIHETSVEAIAEKMVTSYFFIDNVVQQGILKLQEIKASVIETESDIKQKYQSVSMDISEPIADFYAENISELKLLSKKEHYNRLNHSLQRIKNLPKTPELAKKWGYIEAPKSQSIYHGKNNRKFVHPSGSEVVYDPNGKIVVDENLIGTFNFGPDAISASHIVNDLFPYWV